MSKPPVSKPPTVALALLFGSFLAVAMIGLICVVIPGMLQMVLLMFVLGLFFVAQYFLWARWMYQYLVRKEQEKQGTDQSQWK